MRQDTKMDRVRRAAQASGRSARGRTEVPVRDVRARTACDPYARTAFRAGSTLLAVALLAGPARSAPETVHAKDPAERGGYATRSVMAIGGGDAPDAAQFFERLGTLAVDADAAGDVYVLDDGNHRVQVFDANGRFLRSIGGEGQGPGEFSMPGDLSVNEGGDCAVFDVGTMRITVFDKKGTVLRDQIVEEPVREMVLLADRSLVVVPMRGEQTIAYDSAGKELWHLGTAPPRASEEREINIQTPYQQVGSRLALGDGAHLWRGSSDTYALDLLADGSMVRRQDRDFSRVDFKLPEPPKREDGEEGGPRVVMMVQRDETGPDGSTQRSSSIQEGDGMETHEFSMDDLASMLPEYQPDVRAVLGWPDGRVWVVTAADDGDSMVTDEWSADGRYLRRFPLSKDYQFYRVGRDGVLYGVTHDDDDYPIVHKLAVEKR